MEVHERANDNWNTQYCAISIFLDMLKNSYPSKVSQMEYSERTVSKVVFSTISTVLHLANVIACISSFPYD